MNTTSFRWRRALNLLLLLILLHPQPTMAADDTATATVPETPAVAAPQWPGLSDVQPTKATLLRDASTTLTTLQGDTSNSDHAEAVGQLSKQQQALLKQIADLGDPEKWTGDRLIDIRQLLENQRLDQQKRLDLISAQATTLEQQIHDWKDRQKYWQEWEKQLPQPLGPTSRAAIRESLESIDGVLAALDKRHVELVALQQQTATLLETGLADDRKLADALELLRRDLLRQSAPALYSPRFFAIFDHQLSTDIRKGLQNTSWNRPGFFSGHTQLLIGQAVLLLLIYGLIRRFRHKEIAEEWQFLTDQPLAAAVFAAFAGPGLFYVQPPSLVALGVRVLTLGSATFLLPGLLSSWRLLRAFYLLIAFEFGRGLLDALFMPLPVQRLYHLFSCLVAAVYFWHLSRQPAAQVTTAHRNSVLLRLAAILFVAAALCQITGYATLAFLISTLTVNTLFTAVLVLMALTLGRGAIDFLVGLEPLQQWRFFSKHGLGLAARLKLLLQLWLLFEGGITILVIWRLFPTRAQALETLGGFGVTVGDTEVTVAMLFWAMLVMLLTFQVSWLARSLIDTAISRSRRIDRGVRDAVRKMIHYTLLAVGVLLALTTAGVDARVFAVVGGAFGIGIGFGLQNIVNNFVSGIILLFERPIKAGDTIVIDSEWGTVKSIGLRSTVVETLDNSEIIVPNSQLISEKVVNWTLSTPVARIVLPVGVAYGSDIGKVLEILDNIGKAHPLALEKPPVSAIFIGFGASSLDFELRVFLADIRERLRVRSEILHAVARELDAAHIEIPFPQRDLHLRSIDAKVARQLRHPDPPPAGKKP